MAAPKGHKGFGPPAQYTRRFLIQMTPEMEAKIREVSTNGDRSEWIRAAIQEKLDRQVSQFSR